MINFGYFGKDRTKNRFVILSWSTRSKWGKRFYCSCLLKSVLHIAWAKNRRDFMEVSWNKGISRRHEIGSWIVWICCEIESKLNWKFIKVFSSKHVALMQNIQAYFNSWISLTYVDMIFLKMTHIKKEHDNIDVFRNCDETKRQKKFSKYYRADYYMYQGKLLISLQGFTSSFVKRFKRYLPRHCFVLVWILSFSIEFSFVSIPSIPNLFHTVMLILPSPCFMYTMMMIGGKI